MTDLTSRAATRRELDAASMEEVNEAIQDLESRGHEKYIARLSQLYEARNRKQSPHVKRVRFLI